MFTFPFHFSDDAHENLEGILTLDTPFAAPTAEPVQFRTGGLSLRNGRHLQLVVAHSPATAGFMYLCRTQLTGQLLELLGLPTARATQQEIWLPGQVILGAPRTRLVAEAIGHTLLSPAARSATAAFTQDEIVILPVLREGAKYQIANALYQNYGYFCDEALLDSHHVFDPTVPRYNRRVETTILKDQDISPRQRANKKLAVIGDSIASGVVMLGVLALIRDRFEHIAQLEIVAPFATLRGLARLAAYSPPKFRIRVHVFETLLNALPPDYYYSAHFPEPEFHIRPDLESAYRDWWGSDQAGNCIADTACAGYGWAEAFFNPRKQVQMIDEQLTTRHQLTIGQLVERALE